MEKKERQTDLHTAELRLRRHKLFRYAIILVLVLIFLQGLKELSKRDEVHDYLRDHYFKMERVEDQMVNVHSDLLAKLIPDEVPHVDISTMDKKTFYRDYLQKSRPVLIKRMAQEWPAFTKWTNETYLIEQAGDERIKVERTPRHVNDFAYFQTEYGKVSMTYEEFIHKVRDPNRDSNYYFAEEDVPGPLNQDIITPNFGLEMLEPSLFAFWHGIGTVSLPHTDEDENFMCVLSGWKDFTIVSPFQRGLVYPGVHEKTDKKIEYPDNYSPVNFDDPQLDKYPLFANAKVHKVRIEDGDCLYLPSYWWHRVSSSPDETIAVSHWFKAHHAVVNVLHEYMYDFTK